MRVAQLQHLLALGQLAERQLLPADHVLDMRVAAAEGPHQHHAHIRKQATLLVRLGDSHA